MKQAIYQLLAIVSVLYIFYSCNSIFGPEYLPEGEEFSFTLTFPQESNNAATLSYPFSFSGIFMGESQGQYKLYVPVIQDTVKIKFYGLGQLLPLKKDSSYRFIAEITGGWPSAYGLIIKRHGDLLFEGITDWELKKQICIYDSSQIDVSLNKVLANRTHVTKTCKKKLTNLEMRFSAGSEGIDLRQGEYGRLKAWEIILGLAREVEYRSDCLDDGINGISFTIVRH